MLTALEIGVIYLPISKVAIGGMLVLLAGTKAALVGALLHAPRHEKRTLTYIAITPAVLCVFLVLMLLPDLGAITRLHRHDDRARGRCTRPLRSGAGTFAPARWGFARRRDGGGDGRSFASRRSRRLRR